MAIVQRIEISSDTPFNSYVEYQALYTDHESFRLKKNTKIIQDGKEILHINSLGCKGNEPTQDVPIIAVFGASETFCISTADYQDWPQFIKVPGYQVINAGLEGANLEIMCARFHELSHTVQLDGVVVYPGWHNLIYGERGEQYWTAMLDQFQGNTFTAMITPACPLIEECTQRGVEELLSDSDAKDDWKEELHFGFFNLWADRATNVESVCEIFYAHQNFCAFLRHYCSQRGIPCLDLDSFLKPQTYQEVPKWQFDVCHFRAPHHEKIGSWLGEQLVQNF